MNKQINKELFQKRPTEFLKAAWPDIYLWDKLVAVCNSVAQNRRTVMPAGHGVGKTFIEARIALWFLFCFYPAKVITTAPTWPQVEKLLWSEIAKAYNTSKFPLGGRLLLTDLKIEEDWYATGFSTKGKAEEREFGTPKFQGYHSENLLVLLDEAPGVEHQIWTSIDSLITGANNKILAGGNPTSPSGDFYEACKSPFWNKIIISSLDHPNVKENKIIVPGAVTTEWVEERRQIWGETSPLWSAKVLGEFPDEGEDTLIPLSWVEACVNLDLPEDGDKRLGIDVALKGEDKTAFAIIFGKKVKSIETENKSDPNGIIGKAIKLNKTYNFDKIGVDDTVSIGGIVAGLEDAGIEVDGMGFGNSAIEDDKYENLRAEIWWNLREAFRKMEISIQDDKILINQLCSPKYKFSRKGKILLESKDDMRKRGVKSPDRGDALAIAWSAGRAEQAPSITVLTIGDDD